MLAWAQAVILEIFSLMRSLIHSAVLAAMLGSGFSCTASAASMADADTVLDWLEQTYPQYLESGGATTEWKGWIYRPYQGNAYLGVSESDEVYYFPNGFKKRKLVGAFADLLAEAGGGNGGNDGDDNGSTGGDGGNNSGGDGGNDAGGDCVQIDWPTAGFEITYGLESYPANGGGPVTGTVEVRYDSISETMTKTTTSSSVTGGGMTSATSGTETQHYAVADGYLMISKVETSNQVQGYAINSTTTYAEPYNTGPAYQYCSGQTWNVDSVPGSTDIGMGSPISFNSAAYQGEVLAVDESVTIPAGTFQAVHLEIQRADGTATEEWISTEHGILIKQQGYENGTLIDLTEATVIN